VARTIHRLSPRRVSTVAKSGYYADGGGLYLQVSPARTKSWVFRFTLNGRAREMGLGSLDTFALTEARNRALACRKQLDDRIDPIDARDALRAQGRLDAAKALTFSDCAGKYIAAHRAGWRNAKHASQWENTLKTYAEPVIGKLPVQRIDVGLVMRVLEPIWKEKPESASRLRGRIEAILDWASARGLRTGDNPARWRGHLDSLLPARAKVRAVTHHPALPYADIGAFMTSLREQDGVAARALEFAILTTARTGEVLGAKLEEIDVEAKLWTVPAARMKSKREHRVPLSKRAIEILRAASARPNANSNLKQGFIFAGRRPSEPLSNMAMLQLLSRMGRSDLTVHGFRSTFRDWAAESTNYPRELAEAALAHVNADKVEAAYLRGDLFEKRRTFMNAWAKYCETTKGSAKVLPIRKRRAA
jgi:integrase